MVHLLPLGACPPEQGGKMTLSRHEICTVSEFGSDLRVQVLVSGCRFRVAAKKMPLGRRASPQRHREREEKDKFFGRGCGRAADPGALSKPRDPRPEVCRYTFMST